MEAIEETFGFEPHLDWNVAWAEVQRIVKDCEFGWDAGANGAKQKKFFRDCLTESDPQAEAVIAKLLGPLKVDPTALFPAQTLPANLGPGVIHRICGYFPEAKGMHKGKTVVYEADPKLRDSENVPLREDVVSFFLREVRPFVTDAWINDDPKLRDDYDKGIGKVGYEINFNREFFRYEEPRSLKEIDRELADVERKILKMLQEVTD